MSWEQGRCWGACAVSASEGPCFLLKHSAFTGITCGPQQASPMSWWGQHSWLTWMTWGGGGLLVPPLTPT